MGSCIHHRGEGDSEGHRGRKRWCGNQKDPPGGVQGCQETVPWHAGASGSPCQSTAKVEKESDHSGSYSSLTLQLWGRLLQIAVENGKDFLFPAGLDESGQFRSPLFADDDSVGNFEQCWCRDVQLFCNVVNCSTQLFFVVAIEFFDHAMQFSDCLLLGVIEFHEWIVHTS